MGFSFITEFVKTNLTNGVGWDIIGLQFNILSRVVEGKGPVKPSNLSVMGKVLNPAINRKMRVLINVTLRVGRIFLCPGA